MTQSDLKQEHVALVDKLASQCVKCALCLPHCPTYELTKDENESPRGRIALFGALTQEKLPFTEKVHAHLDQCLGCRACERVCPAHVEYGQLLTLGRALLPELPALTPIKQPKIATQFLSWVLTNPAKSRALQWGLWLLQISGLRTLARALMLPTLLGISKLDSLLPPVSKPITFEPFYSAIGEKQGSVLLFTGCLGSLSDQETLKASIMVLRHLGMEVHIPPEQTCCGAIDTHAGNLQTANQLAKQNTSAFLKHNIDYIVSTATGCTAVLQEYAKHFSFSSDLNDKDFSTFSSKVIDIISFVQKTAWPKTLSLSPVKQHVMLHTPCTRRNVLKTTEDPEQFLSRIPGLTWQPFSSKHCCGAAGTYMLEHPEMAGQLAQQLLKEIDSLQVNFIATTNIGCALHLFNQAQKHHPQIKVVHPIVLLAKALGF